MQPLVFNCGVSNTLFDSISKEIDAEKGIIESRSFPDGETYIRIKTDCSNRKIVVLCSLNTPNTKILPLIFSADTLRDLGASQIGLIAPYLAYMRQDKRFLPGEGITSKYFAHLLSNHFDWLITIDPHLHRIHKLDEIYSIPVKTIHAAPSLAEWIKINITNPILIGPDSESKQWIANVASKIDTPYLILEKVRSGDRNVSVSLPQIKNYREHTPVLIDDIISSGQTMIETIKNLASLNMKKPTCIAIHGIFSDGAVDSLYEAGAAQIITCNTIAHETNVIDVTKLLKSASTEYLK